MLSSLKQSLSEHFGIPTDIKFVFSRKEDAEGSTSSEEIRAHKHTLALASDVFMKSFYGGFEDKGSIGIEDATKEAFEAMIHFIYNKETDLSIYDFDLLCSIYYLADKYNITALEEETKKAIKSKDIPSGIVLDIGVLAMKYSNHEKLAEALFEAAAQSLSKIFKGDLNRAVDYLSGVDADDTLDPARYMSVVKIMARLRKINPSVKSLVSHAAGGGKRKRLLPSPRVECLVCGKVFDMIALKYHALMCDGGEHGHVS